MKFLLSAVVTLFSVVAFSQQVPAFKFGKVSESDFNIKNMAVDTGASAIVLADVGSTQVKGNHKGSFSLEYKRLRRILIRKSSAYDYASVTIPLYAVGEGEEELKDLKAVTYNYENGKVAETKLNTKTAVLKEKVNKNKILKKFAFANVREGSIIEYEYIISSDFLFNIQPWVFQQEIPVLWSQYTVSLPQFMNYISVPQGGLSYYWKDRKDKIGSYSVDVKRNAVYGGGMESDRINISCGISDFRWVMKDVPAFNEEAYTSSPENYVAKLEFQLAGYLEPLEPEKIMTTWEDMTKRLLKREDFGQQIEKSADWISPFVKNAVGAASTWEEKARKIYNYVRDQFTCTDHDQLFVQESLKKVAEKKAGGVAEINLLLTAMLRNAGLDAEPVILSTRENGFAYENYPILSRFNYVICLLKAEGKEWLLDAARPGMGFGKLHFDCYNGQARVVNEVATPIKLKANQVIEKSESFFQVFSSKDSIVTQVRKLYGYYESLQARKKIGVEGNESFMKELKTQYGNDIAISDLKYDSLQNENVPLTVYYTLRSVNENADILYVNPVLGERFKQNPLKASERQYPVEMPYRINDTYNLVLQMPDGYVLDELPKSVTLKLEQNGNKVFFEYKISSSANYIMMQYRLFIDETIFFPAEYNGIREFFAKVVAKLDEQIVLKKKK